MRTITEREALATLARLIPRDWTYQDLAVRLAELGAGEPRALASILRDPTEAPAPGPLARVVAAAIILPSILDPPETGLHVRGSIRMLLREFRDRPDPSA